MLIGRHGQTIDAIQYLANAILFRGRYDERKPVTVDAAGYRDRRRRRSMRSRCGWPSRLPRRGSGSSSSR